MFLRSYTIGIEGVSFIPGCDIDSKVLKLKPEAGTAMDEMFGFYFQRVGVLCM